MWRRVSAHIHSLASCRSTVPLGSAAGGGKALRIGAFTLIQWTSSYSTDSDKASSTTKRRVDDIMPIATGLEREELQAELEGRQRFDMDPPVGPFGTKDAPAVIRSYYDKRIVGCPGGEGEDEHDVVWFWLEKGKSHECPVCSQYFVLEVFGPGGPPDGHGDDDEHH